VRDYLFRRIKILFGLIEEIIVNVVFDYRNYEAVAHKMGARLVCYKYRLKIKVV
jgi:hypothetical protein